MFFRFLIYFLCGRVETFALNTLLDGYDHEISPYYASNRTLVVNISMPILVLTYYYSQEQMAAFGLEICLEWVDERLRFNPFDYNNHTRLYLPAARIWIPPFYLSNAFSAKVTNHARAPEVEVSSNGKVVFKELQYAKISCGTVVNRFPFDLQMCNVRVSNSITNQSAMQFHARKWENAEVAVLAEFSLQKYFIQSLKPDRVDINPEVTFCFAIQRKAFYYILVIVLPSTLITTLTITGVLLPTPEAEKSDPVSIGLTSLLALAITLTVVADNIPRTTTVPLIVWFLLVCITLCVISIIFGLLTARLMSMARKSASVLPKFVNFLTEYYQKAKVPNDERPTKNSLKRVIKTFSFLVFLVMQLLLLCNLIVFFSFAWNRKNLHLDPNLDKHKDYPFILIL
ncbi:unnamed protein product, partial [Mesorhabditis belari]|uniref:Neurotransmitter-gated ion-channel ligand-binding domain-containing protein n=1 Tax=Mesorhabditis belari TaxID=2138241 RepID=A0AAF3EKG9_9BILA